MKMLPPHQTKALRVKLFQNTAVYRNPTSSEIIESYPLPPPSTILGLISSTVREQELSETDFNIAIQGKYQAIFRDYQWYIKYNENKSSNNKRYPVTVNTLIDLTLLLYIYCSAERLKQLFRLFSNPPYFLYLGRAEDIIKIDEVHVVDVVSASTEEEKEKRLTLNSYIPSTTVEELRLGGVFYRLPTFQRYRPLTIKNQTKIIRDFVGYTDLVYVETSGNDIDLEWIEDSAATTTFVDKESGNVFWWSLPSPSH
jgi:CRISPR-associated protein Cas5t